MKLVQSTRKPKIDKTATPSKKKTINLYNEIPNMEVSLDDFEEYALDRLRVLKKLDLLKLRHVQPDKHRSHLKPLLDKLESSPEEPHKDWISHFVLRLAYCRTEDLRRWFLAQEVALLRWRLTGPSATVSPEALAGVLPEAEMISKGQEYERLFTLVSASTPKTSLGEKIYRVPFTRALDLVQHRQVYVNRGMAYIPESKLINLVLAKFRTNLSRHLVLLSAVPATPGFLRTQGFLKNVVTVNATPDEFLNKDNSALTDLNPNTVPSHLKHMPLCMAQLQMALQKEKHLKHWGRLQYGLFLKGAGLSLEDALAYFERMFAGKDFNKEYAYNFRHMYGKEGRRQNYPPYACSKIINGNGPNANEHHGCPYRHGTVHELTTLLGKVGVAPTQQKPILALQQSHNYQLACVEHYKIMHPQEPGSSNAATATDNLGNHPNAWFKASVTHHAAHSGSSSSSKGPKMTTSGTESKVTGSAKTVTVSP